MIIRLIPTAESSGRCRGVVIASRACSVAITGITQRAWSKPRFGQRMVALWLAYIVLALVLAAALLLLVEVVVGAIARG